MLINSEKTALSFSPSPKLKKIAVKGTNESGTFEAATDLIKMKHYLTVEAEGLTNEVCSSELFNKAQTFIDETRR